MLKYMILGAIFGEAITSAIRIIIHENDENFGERILYTFPIVWIVALLYNFGKIVNTFVQRRKYCILKSTDMGDCFRLATKKAVKNLDLESFTTEHNAWHIEKLKTFEKYLYGNALVREETVKMFIDERNQIAEETYDKYNN